MKKYIKYIIITFLAICAFFSCKDDDFSTNPAHKLAFSTDTLSFDTIFTSVGSATGVFMIYNRNDKPLMISQIKLSGNENSLFRINVDGHADFHHNNVEIRAKDSLYVFVEVTVNPKNENLPFLVEDSILFYTNTNRQQVKLIAYGQDAVFFRNKTFENDTTLYNEKPYLIYGDLTVNNLTIEQGCRLHFHDKASLIVKGNLTINGTQDSLVILRGDRLDNWNGKQKYDNLPGQWSGIVLTCENATHNIQYANIRNGKTAIKIEKAKLTIENSLIHNFDSCVVNAKEAEIFIGNSLIANCKTHCLNILGGKINVKQTTIGNHYSNSSVNGSSHSHTAASVRLSNFSGETDEFPLEQANFTNTIIYGVAADEISLNKKENSQTTFEYLFENCLLKTKEKTEDAHFKDIIWNKDPKFISTKSPYNFELQSESPAIDILETSDYPFDLNGVSRLTDGKPDLGAYEFFEKPEE